MFFYEGQSCPVCGRAFTESDDIVSCPVCGAPHHRACWQAEGHCHYADAHGTDHQWTRPPKPEEEEQTAPVNRCPNCGMDNPEHAEFCSRCGRDLQTHEWTESADQQTPPQYGQSAPYSEYAPFRVTFDPLGGVPRDEQFEDATAEELALCVGGNTMYYLPRFRKMKNGRTVQWNWAAFFAAPYWLLYRKQYVAGTIVSLFYIAFNLMINAIFHISGVSGAVSYQQALDVAYEAGNFPSLLLLSIAMVVISFTFGLFGNRLYMNSCLKKTRAVRRSDPGDFRMALRRAGGVSFVWGALAYFCINFFSTLFGSFLL